MCLARVCSNQGLTLQEQPVTASNLTHTTSDAYRSQRYSTELLAERTRLLYQGSRIPTLLMLFTGLICAGLLWDITHPALLTGWLIWLVLLAILRLVQVAMFRRALPSQQARPYWRQTFLLGAAASGATMAVVSIWLVPADAFILQTLIFGVIAATIISACVAYAVSMPAFLAFALPCLLPSSILLLASESQLQRGWGVLSLILLLSLPLIAWQVNRLILHNLLRRFENQALIESLAQSKSGAEELNQELAREVEQRRRAERSLRQTHDQLELRVEERTRELDETSRALSKSQTRLAMALEASGLGLWDWNVETDEVHHTQVREIFGLDPQEVKGVLSDLRPRLHPEDVPRLRQALIAHFRGETEGYAVEYRVRHADGSYIWIEDRGRAMARDENGRVQRMVGTRRNIGALKSREEEQRLAATVFEAAGEGIAILDPRYHILAVNEAFSQVTGYRREEALGKTVMQLISDPEARRQYQQIREELELHGQWSGELMERRKSGELYPQLLQSKMVSDAHGKTSHIVCFLADLSLRRDAEERLRYLSHYDELTGLANRSLFKERLHDASQRSRQSGRSLALLHIDLDRFKLLNDSLGHEIADQLLQQMARRLTQAVPEADTIARLSSDEFAVVLDSYTNLSSLARMANRLLGRLRQPLEIAGHELMMSASVGISLMPDNARELQALISQANMAMQHAKHLGGDTFQFFTDNLQAATIERLQLETQLRKGIAEGQLEVYYQPKLNLADDRLDAAEALVRWNHPQLGLVAPGQFISLAEETGLIGAIGEFVLRQACRQAREWQEQGLAELRVSVNLSVHQLRQGNLSSLVRQVLEETGLEPPLLELELTESHLLDNVDNAIEIFRQLDELGVRLAIDDFGTGFSSLSYLKRFPVDCVKIDQSFVRGLPNSSEDAAITRAIIALARSLELQVVAEGVETQAQMDFLKAQHCDAIQGYLISRPVPAERFADLLREQQE